MEQQSQFSFLQHDPVKVLKEGTVSFNPILPIIGGFEKAAPIMEWTEMDGSLLIVVYKDKGSNNHIALGNAIMVGPGIALCAKHVLTDHLKNLYEKKGVATCAALSKSGLQLWSIVEIKEVPESDVMILSFVYRSSLPTRPLRIAAIKKDLPKLGDTLSLVGFRPHSTGYESESGMINVNGEVTLGKGVVTDVFPERRDYLLPGPSLYIDCPTWSGMSGGPVFDCSGYLVGVVSLSFENDNLTAVSSILPSLNIPFIGGWPVWFSDPPPTLKELSEQKGVVYIKV